MFFTVLNYNFQVKKPYVMKKLLIVTNTLGALAFGYDYGDPDPPNINSRISPEDIFLFPDRSMLQRIN